MSARGFDADPFAEPSLVRPYALVRGRTRPLAAEPLPVEAVIVARRSAEALDLRLESAAIVQLGRHPISVAEIAARLSLPVGVVRVLVADLSDAGHVEVNLPVDARPGDTADRVLLERVLAGLEAL